MICSNRQRHNIIGIADMGAVVDWRGATRTWCRDKPNVSTTWVHSTETSVRHSKSSAMWPGQMCRISLPMRRDRITSLPLRREPRDHTAHCWRVPLTAFPGGRDVYMKRVPTQWNGYKYCLWNCESVPNEQQQQHWDCELWVTNTRIPVWQLHISRKK